MTVEHCSAHMCRVEVRRYERTTWAAERLAGTNLRKSMPSNQRAAV